METASEIKAFNKLFADYHGLFVRFANTYLQDEAAAEDIAVEGIMYYWENLPFSFFRFEYSCLYPGSAQNINV